MDFLDSLKEIKGQMVKEQKTQTPVSKPKPNPNRDEFKDIFSEPEVIADKEARLRDEFMEFIKYSDIKKLD
ncbi:MULTISPECIES: hypothetical protein [Campylobacter]|uniref:hypothetical protein n=1 Tax=Campylobacter TaxID=194 RepID=UPI000A35799C|nr:MULTISPECIES: hypothetical protein [unclassified Campylobacter]